MRYFHAVPFLNNRSGADLYSDDCRVAEQGGIMKKHVMAIVYYILTECARFIGCYHKCKKWQQGRYSVTIDNTPENATVVIPEELTSGPPINVKKKTISGSGRKNCTCDIC